MTSVGQPLARLDGRRKVTGAAQYTGDVPFAAPMIGGHEGAGYVEAVGPGVTLTEPGRAEDRGPA